MTGVAPGGKRAETPIAAVLFDMDGVVTDTAGVHMAAWRTVFDDFLRARDPDAAPFTEADYRRFVDGRPRHDGIRAFLAARGITLPDGGPGDAAATTVRGLGARKNRVFREALTSAGIAAFPGTRALLAELAHEGIAAAVFSASRNAVEVLSRAGLQGAFAVVVDGVEMAGAELPGKPDPAILRRTADRLGIVPARTAVIEDAVPGIAAARAGGFAQVIGVDRTGDGAALRAAGADLVVGDLAELTLAAGRLVPRTLQSVPPVWAEAGALRARLSGRRVAVFLDYDGTLTPIVADPDAATLDPRMHATLARLAARVPVAIVSGRDLADVQKRVGAAGLHFAGSHGFDLAGPGGWTQVVEAGKRFLPALAAAADALERRLAGIAGARVERKRFALAVHFRAVAEADAALVAAAVRETVAQQVGLHASAGKKVFDIRPKVDWHKGRAVLALFDRLGLDGPDVLPFYLGDDTTDEDAFRVLADRGVGIVVRDPADRPTAARFSLADTGDVARFLDWLADELSGQAGEGRSADRQEPGRGARP